MNRVIWNSLLVLSVGIASPALASNLTVPNSFTAGTAAVASEVNANFTAVETAVDDNDSRVTALEGAMPGKVDASGDTMTGILTVPSIAYSSPRTHYLAIPGSAFKPQTSTADYLCGNGCKIMSAGSTDRMLATANLPDGAFITGATFYLYDNDATNNLDAKVFRQYFSMMTAYQIVNTVTTASTSTSPQQLPGTMIGSGPPVRLDNASYAIELSVGPASGSTWSSSLNIVGVSITYTLDRAQ